MSRRRGIEILVSANVSDANAINVKYSVGVNTTKVVPIVHGTTNMKNVWTYSAWTAEDKIKSVLESIQNQVKSYYIERKHAFLVSEKVRKTYNINRDGIEQS